MDDNNSPLDPSPQITTPPDPSPQITSPPDPSPQITSPPDPSPQITSPPDLSPQITSPPDLSPQITSPPDPSPQITTPPYPSHQITSPPYPSLQITTPPYPSPPDPSPQTVVTSFPPQIPRLLYPPPSIMPSSACEDELRIIREMFIYECGSGVDCGPKVLVAWLHHHKIFREKNYSIVCSEVAQQNENQDSNQPWKITEFLIASHLYKVRIFLWNPKQVSRSCIVIEPRFDHDSDTIYIYVENSIDSDVIHYQLLLPTDDAQGNDKTLVNAARKVEGRDVYFEKLFNEIDDRSLSSMIMKCVNKAQQLDLKNIKWDSLLETNTTRSIHALHHFLWSNQDIFDQDILNRIAPVNVVGGSESSGKTTLVAGVIGEPIVQTASSRATVAPTAIDCIFTEQCDETICSINTTITTRNRPETIQDRNLTSLQALKRIVAIQKQISDDKDVGGLSDSPIHISMETPHNTLPLRIMDFPGLVGANGGDIYRRGVLSLCKKFIAKCVLPETSKSWLYIVRRWNAQLSVESWLDLIPVERRKDFNRIAVVITRIDELTPNLIKSACRENRRTPGDEALLHLLVGEVQANLKNAKFFLVANAQNLNDAADGEKEFINSIDAIKSEVECSNGSYTFQFLEMLENLPQTIPGYHRNIKVYNQIIEMTGIKTLRVFVYKVSISGVETLIDFLVQFIEQIKKISLHNAKQTQEQILKATQEDSPTQVESLLSTTRDLIYYLMSGENIPTNINRSTNSQSQLPSGQEWDKILVSRGVSLIDEPSNEFMGNLPQFPEGLSQDIEKYLLTKLDPEFQSTIAVKYRLQRQFLAFFIRTLLISPPQTTAKELALWRNMEKSIEQTSFNEFVAKKVESFITKQLGVDAATYISGMTYSVMEHAVDTVILGLKLIPDFRRLLNIPASKFGRFSLMVDLRQFLIRTLCEAVRDDVFAECKKIASAIETPIIPQIPRIFQKLRFLLPSGKAFREQYRKKRMDVTENIDELMNGSPTHPVTSALLELEKSLERIPNQDFFTWEKLSTDKDKKGLVDDIVPVLSIQETEEIPIRPISLTKTLEFEVDNVNHCLMMHTRTAVLLFDIQALMNLPKTYKRFAIPNFLTTAFHQAFYNFISSNKSNSDENFTKEEEDIFNPIPKPSTISHPTHLDYIPQYREQKLTDEKGRAEILKLLQTRYDRDEPMKVLEEEMKQHKEHFGQLKKIEAQVIQIKDNLKEYVF